MRQSANVFPQALKSYFKDPSQETGPDLFIEQQDISCKGYLTTYVKTSLSQLIWINVKKVTKPHGWQFVVLKGVLNA